MYIFTVPTVVAGVVGKERCKQNGSCMVKPEKKEAPNLNCLEETTGPVCAHGLSAGNSIDSTQFIA